MSSLPTGAVTFLLTDIEGSGTLWARHPTAMRGALARHDEILSQGVTDHGGVVIKHRGEGDSFFAVFSRPSDGVVAACRTQIALAREAWAVPEPILVRMALHTGEAELRGGDYFGTAINRCARLRALASGAQILLSSITAELVADHLPEPVGLLDLGEHRLRDLTYPERVFQVLHPELPADFPPLRSLDAHRHNLPVQSVPLVGREREMDEVKSRLRDPAVRLLTLTGPGGVGKTRLALQVAADLLDDFPDGVFLADLAAVTDPALVAPAIAQVFGVRESAGQRLFDRLSNSLRGKHMLLVLDNFEQVLPAADDVAALLSVCPHVKFLVTSRAVLRLSGEHVYTVPPLSLPEHGVAIPAEYMIESEAVRLFVERARSVKPDFRLNAENVEAVVEICRRLDGVPLAIELAAARVRLLSPQAMARRLSTALSLLSGGARDLPARHRALRSTIDWSYRLLDERQRAFFRRLSVFVGGCSLEAIEAIVMPGIQTADDTSKAGLEPFHAGLHEPALDLLDAITALIDASLLEERETPEAEPRFEMLGMIREYGLEQLAAAGEIESVERKHAEYFLQFAEIGLAGLESDEQALWIRRFGREHDNLRAALRWSRARGEIEYAVRLSGAMFWSWFAHGRWSEGIEWLEDSLSRYPDRTVWRARTLFGAGRLRTLLGDFERGRRHYEDSLAISEQLGDSRMKGRALYMLGTLRATVGEPRAAGEMLEHGLEVATEANDTWAMATIRGTLGELAWQAGDYDTARTYLEEAARYFRERHEHWSLAHVINHLGDFMRAQASYDHAETYYEESLQLFAELGVKDGQASVLHNLAYVALNQSKPRVAGDLFQTSLRLFQDLGDRRGVAECLIGFAGVLGATGEPERAASLLGAAQRLFDETGAEMWRSNLNEYGRTLLAVSLELGEDRYSTYFEQGRSTPVERVIAEVLGTTVSAVATPDA
jgi:predicted ATPase/class 3 adenylate cyclase